MDVERRRLERMVRGEAPLFPLARRLRMRLVDLSEGRAALEMPIDERLDNPAGDTHGGALFFLLDTCMGFAATTTLRGKGRTVMVDAHVRFLRPPARGWLRGVGTVVRRGRQVLHVEAEAVDETGGLVARSSGTAFVVRPTASRPGAGRPRAAAASGGTARGSRPPRAG